MRFLRFIIAACLPLAIYADAPCLTVAGDQIVGADMARAVPELAAIPAGTPLALSPIPGGSRNFSVSDLQTVASRFSVTLVSPHEVCFRLAAEPLRREQIEAAMRQSLKMPEASIEILEFIPGPVPVGALEFPRETLSTPSAPDQRTGELWRGNVIYAGTRKFPVWAKVRVTAPVMRLIAVDALRPGMPLRADQVQSEVTQSFPFLGNRQPDRIDGMILLRGVAAGAEIRPENLSRPNDVNRGEMVQVDVRFGGAHLALVGRAESAGRIGDTISVRNLDSSKLFQAMVEGSGKVVVGAPGMETSRRDGKSE
jgi:flagella basal body P-ring formation protein FlgA